MNISLLISGNLGFIVLEHLYNSKNIIFVFTDLKSQSIIDFCKEHNLSLFVGNPRTELANNFILNKSCELLISVNYLYLINSNIISLATGLAFNLHGSLLPRYRGRTPHVWAIINDEENAGITAHVIDEGCDSGAIISQIKVPIESYDTGNSMLIKYSNLYIPIIEDVIFKYNTNQIVYSVQNNSKATYFGKRTPNDGLISWDWQSRRIINWVRAQSDPYPGAYSFYKKSKIIIDIVNYSDFGFSNEIQNGTIISINPLIIKCANATLEIVKLRDYSNFDFRIGEILY